MDGKRLWLSQAGHDPPSMTPCVNQMYGWPVSVS